MLYEFLYLEMHRINVHFSYYLNNFNFSTYIVSKIINLIEMPRNKVTIATAFYELCPECDFLQFRNIRCMKTVGS